MRANSTIVVLAVCALFAAQTLLLLDGIHQNFVTIDEFGHIASGVGHWQTGSFSMYRVNPPLARMLAVVPVMLARPNSDYQHLRLMPGSRPEWEVGKDFTNANDARYFQLVCLARLAGIAWAVLGGFIIFHWATTLYGTPAGLVGLVFWSFGPNILANAQMVTPDIPAAVAGLAATFVFWKYLRTYSWGYASFSGIVLGIAQLTKSTFLIFYAVWPLLWLTYRLRPLSSQLPQSRITTSAGQLLTIFLLSIFVINLGYRFDATCRPLGEFPFVSQALGGDPPGGLALHRNGSSGNRFRGTWLGFLPVPVPADYLLGIDVQKREFESSLPSYLRGKWQHSGWWYYYLYALAIKVPLAFWAILAWSIVDSFRNGFGRVRWQDELILWLPAVAILAAVSSQTGFNHHMRYILPAFPFVIIVSSKVGHYFQSGRGWLHKGMVSLLLVWFLVASLSIHPHQLSHFNELVGGPEHGHEHLLNSNIDWGQDLLFLKKWLDQHPEACPLGLAYCNLIDPRIVGIQFTLPPRDPPGFAAQTSDYLLKFGPHPGYFAVSVNYVQGSTSIPPPDGKGGTAWPPPAYSYFRRFQPIAKAGYSIFIYHIALDEANRVRRELGLPELTGEGAEEKGS